MSVAVKICGVNDAAAMEAAAAAGADLVGFVFFPPSPRAVTPARAAAIARPGPLKVGLFVDPDDALVAGVLAALPLDLVQLHGEETPERCATIRARFGVPVMKALGVASREDLAVLEAYAPAVDRFLLDAKAPPGAPLPGGNAAPFDWSVVAGAAIPRPWLLAGGLTPANVAEAVRVSGAPGVDVSSGVEKARGVKDPARIAAFVAAARGAASCDAARGAASTDAARGAASRDAARGAASGDTARGAASRDAARGAGSRDAARGAVSGDTARGAASGDTARGAEAGTGACGAGLVAASRGP